MPHNESLHAEIIAIGDELTSGQRLDTNSQWLSQQLGDLGVRTLFHSTVADDLDSNIAAFRIASKRADIVIATGGLGPTADDLTRESMAQAFECSLVEDKASLEKIQAMFSDRGREMPERNRVQAMFPQGSQAIFNPHGTAPGVDLTTEDGKCRIFALPGVPAEMKEMYAQTVQPALLKQFAGRLQPLRHFRLKCFGTGESALEEMLPDIIRRGRTPTVGITVSNATITLRVSAQAESKKAFEQLIQPTVSTIQGTLGDLVFGQEDEELQHAVYRLLSEANKTMAVAEWGSAGLIGNWMRQAANDDHLRFVGGFVVTGKESANKTLGVSCDLDLQDTAKALACAAREKTQADFGISVGPFPGLATDNDPKVFLGLATPDSATAVGRRFAGHPSILMPRAAKQALNELRLFLLKQAQ